MKKAVISTFIIILCISVYASSAIRKSEDDRICNELSKTVYNIVNESYVNYGNIKNSKYKDIISPEDYSKMNYLGITNLNDPDSQNIKRSEIDILISYHTEPVTERMSANLAVTTYNYEKKIIVDGTPVQRDGLTWYKDGRKVSNTKNGCTVVWEKLEDGKWHIASFYEPI